MSAPAEVRPHGLWSLWDMINYQVFGLVGWLMLLDQERRIAESKSNLFILMRTAQIPEGEQPHPLSEYVIVAEDRKRLKGLLDYAGQLATQLNLIRTEDRIGRFEQALRPADVSPIIISQQLKTLHEALQDDLKFKYFYAYPDNKATKVLRVEVEWSASIAAFNSIKDDAKSATDCYALGHYSAAVFNCILVLEKGLLSLAESVGLTFDVQQWKNILDEIEKAIDRIRQNGIPGLDKAAKDARLQFLSEAAKEFFYFKDAWRN